MSRLLSFRICSFLLLVTFAEAFLFAPNDLSGKTTYNGYRTPKFSVLKKTEAYELREYEATNWVATSSGSSRTLFMRLFRYITANQISMTVPVTIKRTPDKQYTMAFYLTGADNPKPSDPNVFLISHPAEKVYVRTYSGYSNDAKLTANLAILKSAVGEENLDLSYYSFAGYDNPWKFWNRRNEVRVLAKKQ